MGYFRLTPLKSRKISYIGQYNNAYIGLYKNVYKTLGDLAYIDLYTSYGVYRTIYAIFQLFQLVAYIAPIYVGVL